MSEPKTSDRRLAVLRPFAGRGGRNRRNSTSDPVESTPSTSASPTKPEASVVDSAIYREGDRIASPKTLAETYHLLDDDSDTMAWIGLYRPNERQLASLADQFDLHDLALEDAILAHQRPKLERYDQTLFVVLRAARYLDDVEEVEFGELHVFIGENFVVTVRHSESPDLSAVRRRMESNPDLLMRGPEAVLYAILDRVVDGYVPVADGLENDIDEIETEVFRGDPSVSRRIYELSREVIEFQRATRPLLDMLTRLSAGFTRYHVDEELQRYLRDVRDHVEHVTERVDGFRQLLQDILTVNATLVTQKQNEDLKALAEAGHSQNEELKKISAWAAILFAPTLIGTVYGMNFDHMPETSWLYGYPIALLLMAATCLGLYLVFKGRDWL
jgi:magnesium transporter